MNARSGTWTAVALMMLTPIVAAAQPLLTIEEALQAARTRNASLRAATAASSTAAAEISVARSALFPRVTLGDSWQRGNDPVFVFSSRLSSRQFTPANFAIGPLNHPDAIGFAQAHVSVEQVVFDGGRRRAALDVARSGHDRATASADEALAGVLVATTEAFGRVVVNERSAEAARAALAHAREDQRLAEQRRDAGMATDADVLALLVQAADLERRVIQASGDAAVARAEVNRLVGAPVDREFRAVEPATSAAAIDTSNVAALLSEAERARPEARRAAAALREASAALNEARSALWPELVAQGGVAANGLRFADRVTAWTLGASLRWTVSTGGSEHARTSAARHSVERAQAEVDDSTAAVQVEVIAAVRRLDSARARQRAGGAAVDQAREHERIVRNRFEAGMAGVTDVLRAAAAVLDAEANRTAAMVDASIADATLRRALGRTP